MLSQAALTRENRINNRKFDPPSPADLVRLVQKHPLAWLVSCVEGAFSATLLPLRPVVDSSGVIVEFRGHFARSNAHVGVVRDQSRAIALFLGPQGYISPSWMKDRTQAPTWAYASARFDLELALVEGGAQLDDIIHDLVDAMEAGRPGAWRAEEMGTRYRRLASGVVGFHARVLEQRAKFKLGQDERADVFEDITAALAHEGPQELHEWIQHCNSQRTRGASG
ncbi:MAG: FMN-binding negative transcriptional regulator [Gammaproteobacteria bacterium]